MNLLTGADRADWRDERSYDYTAGLTLREWAWEFLRRNPAFQRDLTAARQHCKTWSLQPFLDMVASAGDLSRWGVLFRGVLWPRFGRILVSALVRPCAAGHCGMVACLVADTAVRTLGIALSCNRPAGARQEPACSSSQCGPRAAARRLGREYPPPCLPAYASHLARGAFKASIEGTGVPQCSQSRATIAAPLVCAGKARRPFVLRSSCARRFARRSTTSRARRSSHRSTARPCRLGGSSRSSARPHPSGRLAWPRAHEWWLQRFPSLKCDSPRCASVDERSLAADPSPTVRPPTDLHGALRVRSGQASADATMTSVKLPRRWFIRAGLDLNPHQWSESGVHRNVAIAAKIL